jgi:GNAT superfamily N-acetyltransferase
VIVREAAPEDAEQLVDLIAQLDHRVTAAGIRQRIHELGSQDLRQLVAVDGEALVGLCGLHRMTAIHRERPVGRITILVVAHKARGSGIGRLLMNAAEQRLRAAGCGLVEVTSNDRLAAAHEFYEHLGYQRTSKRFAKEV